MKVEADKQAEAFDIKDLDVIASLAKKLEVLARTHLGEQALGDMIVAVRLVMDLAPVLDRIGQDTQQQIGPKASFLRVGNAYREWKLRIGRLTQICSGVGDGTVSLKDLSDQTRQVLELLRGLLNQCRSAAEEQLARARLQSDLLAIDDQLAAGMLVGWRPLWQRVSSKTSEVLAAEATADLAQKEVAIFASSWESSLDAGGVLAKAYGSQDGWPIRARGPGETSSAWLLTALRAAEHWGEHQLARMLKLRPAELPVVPVGLAPPLTAPVAQLAFEVEVGLASLRAKAVGVTPVIESIAALREQANTDGYLPRPEARDCLVQLLADCAWNSEFLVALSEIAVILDGEEGAVEVCRYAITRVVGAMPGYLALPHFARNDTGVRGYGIIAKAVQDDSVDLAFAFRVFAAQPDWRSIVWDDSQSNMRRRLLELGPVGWWVIASLLGGHPAVESNLVRKFVEETRAAGGDCDALLPLVAMQCADLSDEGILSLLASLELVALRRQCGVTLRAMPTFVQRFGGQYPVLCARLRTRMVAHGASSGTNVQSAEPASGTVVDSHERAHQAVKVGNYRGVKCLERLSRRFVEEHATPLLSSLEGAANKDAIRRIVATLGELDTEHIIDQWGREFPHGPEGQLRQRLIDDCREMLDAIRAFGEDALRNPKARSVERQSLKRELQELHRLGDLARQAADFLEGVLVGEMPSVTIPGSPLPEVPVLWRFPQLLALWNAGNLDIARYGERFGAALVEDPRDYALSEAASGRVNWAVQVMDKLGVPADDEMRLGIEEKAREWAELVALDQQEVLADLGDEAKSNEVREMLARIAATVTQRNYVEAVEELEKLGIRAASGRNRRREAQLVREDLGRGVEQLVLNASRAKLPVAIKTEWTQRIFSLQERVTSGTDLSAIQKELESLAERLAKGEAPPSWGETSPTVCPLPRAASDESPISSGQLRDLNYCGIVKRCVGAMYAFIAPFDERLLDGEDVYFHKTNVSHGAGVVPELPQPGSLVGFRGVTRPPEQKHPGASEVWILSPTERAGAMAALSKSLRMRLDDVGFLSGQTLFTIGQGFHSVAGFRIDGCGPFFVFRAGAEGQSEAGVLLSYSTSQVSNEGTEFFRRLSTRAFPPERQSTFRPLALTVDNLSALAPSRPNSYRDAKTLQTSIRTDDQHRKVVQTVKELVGRGFNEGQVAWLRAVLAKSFLVTAKEHQQPVHGFLSDLVSTAPDWFGSNQDATLSLLHQSLHSFADENPQELSHEEMWRFFKDIQERLGPRPHYRLELNMAYTSMEGAEQEGQTQGNVERAASHIRRAMVINPRLSECHDLWRQLETRFGWRSDRGDPARLLTAEPTIPAHAVQVDPVDATEDIRRFYDDLGGRSDEDKAKRFFGERRQQVSQGLALDELLGRHCRYLLTCDAHAEAENLLLAEARQDHVADWPMVVNLLRDIWRALDLDEVRVRESVARLTATLPAAARPHLEFLLANLLFDRGRYDSALRHATTAQEVLRSVDTRQLVSRCEQVVRTGDRAASAGQTRDKVWAETQSIAAEGDSAAVADFVLNHMDNERVGPWLVWKCVSESGVFAQDVERRSLVIRARSLERTASVELLKADLRVRWDASVSNQVDCLKEALLEAAVKDPQTPVLEEIDHALTNAATAFAVYDSLLQIHPSALAIRWRLAMAAKRLASGNRERKYVEEYVQASLPCVGGQLPNVTPAVVANDLISMRLFGLAAVVAHAGAQGGQKGLTEILRFAIDRAVPAPWEWPSALQRSRVELDEGWWWVAIDSLICTILANPCHWPTCRTYLKAFTDPKEEDPVMLKAASGIALSGVQLALTTQQGRESPELLVLQAELLLAAAALEDSPAASDKAAQTCSDLCSKAQRLRQGFRPAILLQNGPKPGLSLAPGETYAKRYRIVEALPPGSYGQVYRADVLDPPPGDPSKVALKLVRADAPTPEKRKQQWSALAREARIALRLKHPAIVRVFEFLDNRCLVMEFIEGSNLVARIDSRVRVPWRMAHQIGIQIAGALEYATDLARREFGTEDTCTAAREFAHRDIHPGNIMVTENDGRIQAKLLDFGLARVPGGTATTAVFAGVNRRLVYRAPEYGSRMDHRGDMFALGVVLYELLTGEGPYPYSVYCDFQNSVATPEETARSLRRVGDLLKEDAEVPDIFCSVLAKMVAFRCADRHNDWTTLIRDLREAAPQMGGYPT